MPIANTTATEVALRETFRKMSPDDYQKIRDAYYKADEGLRALANALEMADLRVGPHNEELLEEHVIACSAIDCLNRSTLGRVL